ncbi:DUF3040 domain-containing protein [Pseudonocardia phyllosphaerae]|uniref:DUF3040 domain-containing protein n=1 Tax=Pseudonocardia phyllosphaerae TaxID=3390502 RepID=UPI00397DA59E
MLFHERRELAVLSRRLEREDPALARLLTHHPGAASMIATALGRAMAVAGPVVLTVGVLGDAHVVSAVGVLLLGLCWLPQLLAYGSGRRG